LENQKFRTNYANNSQTHARKFEGLSRGPPLPRKPVQQLSNAGRQPFIPHLAYVPQTPRVTHYVPQQQYGGNYQQHYGNLPTQPPRPSAPKPQPRPEPMDVDRSMQTKQVNYMNRPRFGQQEKRPSPQGLNGLPDKKQRNFHIDTASVQNTDELTETDEATLNEYYSEISDFDQDTDEAEHTELNLLE